MKDNSIPLKLATILADGEFHSNIELGMNQTTINNHIQILKEWGLDVLTVAGKGYCLPEPIELLDKSKIDLSLERNSKGVSIIPIINSTNQYLLERINTLQTGDVCIAEYQKVGRGRFGRQWFSPFGVNIYLSMYWKLSRNLDSEMGISLVIGIVIAKVLHQIGVNKVRVKWPNDLYLNNRKLAGILVEIGRTNDSTQIVFGAGINLAMRNPNNGIVNQNWINLQEEEVSINRNSLISILINQLRYSLKKFEREGLKPFITYWHYLDHFIDRPVKLLIGNREVSGIARGIDSRGGILVEQNGITKSWLSGEISLRS